MWLMRQVKAPPGRLGIVLAGASLGVIVKSVNPTCPFRRKVLQGDLIVGIDRTDVSEMTFEQVVGILKKSSATGRNLVMLRQYAQTKPNVSQQPPAAKKRKTSETAKKRQRANKERYCKYFPDAIAAYDDAVADLPSVLVEDSLVKRMLSSSALKNDFYFAILWVCFGDYLYEGEKGVTKQFLATRLAKKILANHDWRKMERGHFGLTLLT